ncbi:SDR family oxidoreductase [Mariniflexile sp. HNIBRBA6329]|uniref:SDR family oxidoreductase n=1 Tax=Mariniflexile sp. HNIBRBA6329 TaxID=3373088 RepID=UPI0037473CFE
MILKTFKDKVVLITGSSRGIGKTTALTMAKKGASIMLNGRNLKKLLEVEKSIKDIGGKVSFFCCDISDQNQAKELVDYTIKIFGKLDVLINNAGVSMRGNFSELNPEVFRAVFDVNVFGSVNTSIHAIPHIRKSKGSVVFVSSVAGIRGLPNNSAYCSSKMALRAIAESIRIEEVNSNIHVGLIFVGITEIEKEKTTIDKDGALIILRDRAKRNVQTLAQVASSIVNNIKKRKFRTTLTGLGRLNAFLQPILPDLVERILIRSNKKIEEKCL